MVQHAAAAVRGVGVDRVVVVASPQLADMPELREAIGDDAIIAIQPERLGTADALRAAMDACGDGTQILSVHGDAPLLVPSTLEPLLHAHQTQDASVTLLTAVLDDPFGFGRVQRGNDGTPARVVEQVDADPATLDIREVNTGCYVFEADWLWNALPRIEPSDSGEAYLTDIVARAAADGRKVGSVAADEPTEVLGVNDRAQLADVETLMRERIRREWMLAGVTFRDPGSIYVDIGVSLGQETVLLPGTHLLGSTSIGEESEIGPNTVLKDCAVGDGSYVVASHGESSRVGDRVSIGPFSRLRPGTVVADGAHVGNYVELKNTRVGPGAHVGHFSYLGDATIGSDANIGAGTVTCNYDGVQKHETIVGDRAFIGSGSMLVAPITIGEGAVTGAGSVIKRDVPAGATVAGVPAREIQNNRTRGAVLDRRRGGK